MVMLVSWRIDRIAAAFLLVTGLAGAAVDSWAQQPETPKRTQQQKPPPKPAQRASKPRPEPAPTEALAPSQIGIGTLAQFAFMVDPQTSTVLLFKDADKPMHPSSMAKLMTIYIAFEEINAGRLKLDTRFRVSERARNMGGSRMLVELGSEGAGEARRQGLMGLHGNDA